MFLARDSVLEIRRIIVPLSFEKDVVGGEDELVTNKDGALVMGEELAVVSEAGVEEESTGAAGAGTSLRVVFVFSLCTLILLRVANK